MLLNPLVFLVLGGRGGACVLFHVKRERWDKVLNVNTHQPTFLITVLVPLLVSLSLNIILKVRVVSPEFGV